MSIWREFDSLAGRITKEGALEHFLAQAHREEDWPGKKATEKEPILHSAEPGVYAFAREEGGKIVSWLYVGSTSIALGSRVWQHKTQHPEAYRDSNALLTLPCHEHAAPLMEKLLIAALAPKHNTQSRR